LSDRELVFREGTSSDLWENFELSSRALHWTARSLAVLPQDSQPDEAEIHASWLRERPFVEFMAAQPGRCLVCERDGELLGHARITRFREMEHLTEIMVDPACHGVGIGRGLLERLWPGTPSPQTGRIVVAAGSNVDLSLYTAFGAMPVTGHWHLRLPGKDYLERRSHEDAGAPDVHVLTSDRAVEEWKRLEPPAVGHERPLLHEFFGRTRSCLACMSSDRGGASALCWVSPQDEIGPAVGETAEALVPVVLAALDRVATQREPETLSVFCTTDSWWLLDRLRRLGFHVFWPSWVMSSVPLPGLDRYLPTWPARLL
jgi:GNAT superfamily N-acetyltransferase